MKKAMMTAMAAIALSGVAGAQSTWTYDEIQYVITACYRMQDGNVGCDLTGTYKGDKASDDHIVYAARSSLITPAGDTYPGVSAVYKGKGDWAQTVSYPKGVPAKTTIVFKVPAGINTVSFTGEKGTVANIPVRASATAPATAPVAAPAPAQINIAGTWNATLTNCRQASGGVVVCTATLRK